MMNKWRAKVTEVDAVRAGQLIADASYNWKGLPDWMRAAYEEGGVVFAHDCIYIKRPDGELQIKSADWVICGAEGDIYSLTDKVFKATYEPAEAGADGPVGE